MRATLEKEYFMQFARSLSIELKMHQLLWEQSLEVFHVRSPEYRAICATGRKMQTLYIKQREFAYQYLTEEEVDQCFTVTQFCGFS